METEKRFLVAFALILGILATWSLLTPPEQRMQGFQEPATLPHRPDRLEPRVQAEERILRFPVGRFELGVGERTGGIQTLRADGAWLLEGASPGLLQLEATGTGEPIPLQTAAQGDQVVSRGNLSAGGSEGTEAAGGVELTRTLYTIPDRSQFLLGCRLEVANRSDRPQPFSFRIAAYRPLHAQDPLDQRYLSGLAWVGGKPETLHARRPKPQSFPRIPFRISSQGKSHAVILEPGWKEGMFHVEHGGAAAKEPVGWIEVAEKPLAPGETRVWESRLYAGPLDLAALERAGLAGSISFGSFSGIAEILLRFLSWSEGWLHNYGLAICFLSIAVWLPFSPLTWYGSRMSSKTMQKMAQIKPQMERIQREHRDNPAKMQQEIGQLYRKHGVNPAAGCLGCLPLFLTMPIYIALFQVLNRAPELRGAGFLWIRDLAAPDGLIRFPTALPLLGSGLNVLPILATAATFLQQKFMAQPQAAMTEEQRIQQKMLKFFPLLFLIFFYHLPAGFMLYWVVNSILMVGQQILVARLKKA